jgi:hypothetical protein
VDVRRRGGKAGGLNTTDSEVPDGLVVTELVVTAAAGSEDGGAELLAVDV